MESPYVRRRIWGDSYMHAQMLYQQKLTNQNHNLKGNLWHCFLLENDMNYITKKVDGIYVYQEVDW